MHMHACSSGRVIMEHTKKISSLSSKHLVEGLVRDSQNSENESTSVYIPHRPEIIIPLYYGLSYKNRTPVIQVILTARWKMRALFLTCCRRSIHCGVVHRQCRAWEDGGSPRVRGYWWRMGGVMAGIMVRKTINLSLMRHPTKS